MTVSVCALSDCSRTAVTRGYCKSHYKRLVRRGELELTFQMHHSRTPMQRWAKFVKLGVLHDHCWRWTGGITAQGYGGFYYDGKEQLAHRDSYERFIGPVPDDLELDHLCKNTWCVNPEHLEPVTTRENCVVRANSPSGKNLRKTHCVHGHAFTPENTYFRRNPRRGMRQARTCRTCAREAARVTNQRRVSSKNEAQR